MNKVYYLLLIINNANWHS